MLQLQSESSSLT